MAISIIWSTLVKNISIILDGSALHCWFLQNVFKLCMIKPWLCSLSHFYSLRFLYSRDAKYARYAAYNWNVMNWSYFIVLLCSELQSVSEAVSPTNENMFITGIMWCTTLFHLATDPWHVKFKKELSSSVMFGQLSCPSYDPTKRSVTKKKHSVTFVLYVPDRSFEDIMISFLISVFEPYVVEWYHKVNRNVCNEMEELNIWHFPCYWWTVFIWLSSLVTSCFQTKALISKLGHLWHYFSEP